MSDIASYIRIFEASPSDDFVEKRQTAIAALAEQYKKRTLHADVLGLADLIARTRVGAGAVHQPLADHAAAEGVGELYVERQVGGGRERDGAAGLQRPPAGAH